MPPKTFPATLRTILLGLLAALGAWRLEPTLALVLYRRVSRTLGRIERMLVRFRVGGLWHITQRDVVPGRTVRGAPAVALPRRFGWLMQSGGHHAAYFSAQLQAALRTPEMLELLEASPQAGRILRPLCRALAVQLPWVIDKVRMKTQRHKRASRAKPEPEPFRIPLPRGVMTAARRAGFGKDR